MDGNLIWFGTPLKDSDINDLKKSKIIFNRYPEADVYFTRYLRIKRI